MEEAGQGKDLYGGQVVEEIEYGALAPKWGGELLFWVL